MKHLYTDGIDTVVAESETDAERVWESIVGDKHRFCADAPFHQVPNDQPLTLTIEDENEIDQIPAGARMEMDCTCAPYPLKVTAPASAWADLFENHHLIAVMD